MQLAHTATASYCRSETTIVLDLRATPAIARLHREATGAIASALVVVDLQ